MSELNFGLRISAKDDSQGVLRGALAGFQSFARTVAKPITIPLRVARGSLGLLRDVNLGLAPIVRGMDRIIERGSGLEVVRKSFQSLTGSSPRQAQQLARRLVEASNGALRIAKAMQIANRAIASGIKVSRDLPTILDFAAKKAVTTGMGFEFAMDRIIMGLSRGSAPILDDFGLLNDGLVGVSRAYDAIAGKGAFKDLGPAAQKAELVRQAMVEIQHQLGRMGVGGKESVFVFQAIKSQVGDALDKLSAAVVKSKGLRDALSGVRDIMGGMAAHLEKGKRGGFLDILLGKKGDDGKRTGGSLLGILKAGLMDVGEWLGRGILSGILGGLSEVPELFKAAGDFLKKSILGLWDELVPKIRKLWDELIPSLITALQSLADALAPIAKWLGGMTGGNPTTQPATTQPATTQPATTQPATTQPAGRRSGSRGPPGIRDAVLDSANKSAVVLASWKTASWLAGYGLKASEARAGGAPATALGERALRGSLKFVAKRAGPAAVIADFLYTSIQFGRAAWGLREARGELQQARDVLAEQERMLRSQGRWPGSRPSSAASPLGGGIGMGIGMGVGFGLLGAVPPGTGPTNIFQALREASEAVRGGGSGASRTRGEVGAFLKDFPPSSLKGVDIKPVDPSKFPLSLFGRRNVRRQIGRLEHEIDLIEGGNRGVRQEALRRTGEQVARLRGEGRAVKPSRRREIFDDTLRQLIESQTGPRREQIGGLQRTLEQSGARERLDREQARGDRLKREADREMKELFGRIEDEVQGMRKAVDTAVGDLGGVLRRLIGGERRLAATASKRD